MPGYEAGIMGLLDEEAGVPAQDIRSQQILDGVQDRGMADHIVDPREQHVAAVTYLGLDRASACGFILLELAAKAGHFTGAQRIDRKMVAAVAIAGDLLLVQQFGHSIFLRCSCFALGGRACSKRGAGAQCCQAAAIALCAGRHLAFFRCALPIQ